MRAELANLNHCAGTFLRRADANLRWYYHTERGMEYGEAHHKQMTL